MPKYILLHEGEATDMSAMSPEQVQEQTNRWGAWMGKIGDAPLDGGHRMLRVPSSSTMAPRARPCR